MANNPNSKKLKGLIDDILNQKFEIIHSRVDNAINNIITNMEKIKDLNELSTYEIPKDFELKPATGEPSKEEKIDFIHKYIKDISSSETQLKLINNLLEGINHFCSRAALFLLRDDKLVGWKGKGFTKQGGGINDGEINKIFFSLSAKTILNYVLDKNKIYSGTSSSQPDDHLIYSRFGGSTPEKIFVLPFCVKGKPQAVVYTDSLEGQPIGKKEIEMIAIIGEMSLDLLPLRQKLLSKVKTKEYVEAAEEKPDAPFTTPEAFDDEKTVLSIRKDDPARLARVIINDIILYNKKVVEDGRTNRNLHQVLGDTISQAKELYLNKFTDLKAFEEQLIETLAQGDKEALKGYNFETL
jgi:hypothetical protein